MQRMHKTAVIQSQSSSRRYLQRKARGRRALVGVAGRWVNHADAVGGMKVLEPRARMHSDTIVRPEALTGPRLLRRKKTQMQRGRTVSAHFIEKFRQASGKVRPLVYTGAKTAVARSQVFIIESAGCSQWWQDARAS